LQALLAVIRIESLNRPMAKATADHRRLQTKRDCCHRLYKRNTIRLGCPTVLGNIVPMSRIQFLAALIVSFQLSAMGAFAGAQGDPSQTCDGSTAQMVDCLKAQTAEWDKRLNIAFEKVMKDASPKQHDQLRTAQRLWIQFRDANCLFYSLGEGTIAQVNAGECLRSMTEARARELEGLAPL
jgi:uncharacterized protein YecT (DUF1311 family)